MQVPSHFSDTENQLHELAIAATGLDDFGSDESYREGLGRILRAVDSGPLRSASGKEYVWNTILGCLVARLFAVKGWKEHPECLGRPINRPLIITGVPRTGTTALHKLLSMDPQFQGLEMWLTSFPMPRPPRETWQDNPCYQAVVANLNAFYEAVPHFRAVHLMVADEVDECLEVLKHTFVSNRFGSTFTLPDYDDWWLNQDELPSYRFYADVLRLIGANDQDKPWLLKNPGHVWSPEALLEVFPDACVVQTHRDPAKAIPSLCSTLVATQPLIGIELDLKAIGKRETQMWSEAMRRTMAFRKKHPENFLDVDHRDFHSDPFGVVKRIYAHFGFELSPEAESRMQQRSAASPEMSHGVHSYAAEDYGLSRESLREIFHDYIQHFDL